MIVSEVGLKLIAEFEGFAPYLYNDPVGHATVAYGFLVHLGPYHEARGQCAACDTWPRKREPKSTWITAEHGRQLLREKVKPYAATVEKNSRPLNQGEFDALSSFCFNVGSGGYIGSTVRTAVNNNGNVCLELRRYVFGVGYAVALPGLIRRRNAECALFNSNIPPAEEEDMWTRFNGVANWWTNRRLSPNKYVINTTTDFPNLPGNANILDLEIYLSPASTGKIIVSDGDTGNYAGQVNPLQRQAVIRAIRGTGGTRIVRLDVYGDVTVELLGIVAYM